MSHAAPNAAAAADRCGATVVILAKLPRPGHVKTRLIPVLGPQGTADLARTLLLRTVRIALEARPWKVELCVTPSVTDPGWASLQPRLEAMATAAGQALDWSSQAKGDLGQRMLNAAADALRTGNPVILTGTDCLEFSPQLLRQTARALAFHDAVMQPAHDGGYALLGLQRVHPRLFEAIPWGHATVALHTRERMAELGWSLQEGACVHDIDTPEDLQRLRTTMLFDRALREGPEQC